MNWKVSFTLAGFCTLGIAWLGYIVWFIATNFTKNDWVCVGLATLAISLGQYLGYKWVHRRVTP